MSLAVAELLVAASISNTTAEDDGFFAGVHVGLGRVKAKTEFEADTGNATMGIVSTNAEKTASSFRYGIMAGYKQFFTQNCSFRQLLGGCFQPHLRKIHAHAVIAKNLLGFSRQP